MTDPYPHAKTPGQPDEINFLDPDIQECPYPSYELLRNEAPRLCFC